MNDPQIGVMLPLRLETVFEPPDGADVNWKLWVLVAPDVASIDHFDQGVSEFELASLEAMWRAANANLWSPEGKQAFRLMADRFGPARSIWLARTFPPLRNALGGIAEDAEGHVLRDWQAAQARLREKAHTSTIAGLPAAIEIWIGRGGGPPIRLDPPIPVDPTNFKIEFGKEEEAHEQQVDRLLKGLSARFTLDIIDEEELREIDVILAIGIGDEKPDELFRHHGDSGELAVLAAGTPTNTISGQPAADLGRDPETWCQLWLGGSEQGAVGDLGWAIAGDRNTVGMAPDSSRDHRAVNEALVRALWPGLWGHTLKDVWNMGNAVHDAGLWAHGNVHPEGPLPPIRLDDQPYGVLPVTSLRVWKPAPGDPGIEQTLARDLTRLRRRWARSVEERGNIVDADTERLLDLLSRTPSSTAHSFRTFAPLELFYLLVHSIQQQQGDPNPVLYQRLVEEWERVMQEPLGRLPLAPVRRYVTMGYVQDLTLPLVQPIPRDEEERALVSAGESLFHYWLKRIMQVGDEAGASAVLELQIRPPNSLLLRLIIYSIFVADVELRRLHAGSKGPLIQPLHQNMARTELQHWLNEPPSFGFRDILQGYVPAALLGSAAFRLYQGLLESASVLVNFDTNLIERAFRATLDCASHRIDPWVTGVAWRRLNTMRAAGATTGLGVYGWVDRPYRGQPGPTRGGVLHAPSDAQLRAAVILRDKAINDPEQDRWKLALDSNAVRLAKQFADEVRAGSHIQEVLGRAVERVVASRELIKKLRDKFFIRAEHGGRRVCDGQKVLATTDGELTALGLTAAHVKMLQPLRRIVDAYGDLLVADAVFHVVSGRAEAAAEAMEAAPGLGWPPAFDVLRAPRHGRTVNTVVLAALQDIEPPLDTEPGASPGELAEPAFAKFLAQAVPAEQWRWRRDDGGEVALGDLGLSPVDTLALSIDTLEGLARAKAAVAITDTTAADSHRRARRLAATFGGRPAQLDDLLVSAMPLPEQVAAIAAAHGELRARYTRVREAAEKLRDALTNAADEARQVDALRAALRWGIAPTPSEEEAPPDLVVRAIGLIEDRLAAASKPADLATLSLRDLATALAELASPGGQLPVFSRLERADLNAALPEGTEFEKSVTLDREWLEVIAAVRPVLARIEAYQLEAAAGGGVPLQPFVNRAGDPWQANVARDVHGLPLPSTLVTAYSVPGALDGPSERLALTVLDSWSETVPEERHTTATAFGFNAPSSRPPQAILIAVPPDEAKPLDTATIMQIVLETRELARARMATPEDLAPFGGFLPLSMLPAERPDGVPLHIIQV